MSLPTKDDYVSLAGFRRALRAYLRFAERTARDAGITPQQHQALLAVRGQPGREWASATEIRDALQIGHNAAVGLVDRCQAAGLFSREPDEADRRVVRVSLTQKGRDVLDRITAANLVELRATESLAQSLRILTEAMPDRVARKEDSVR